MGQMNLFELSYKYVMDASVFLSQKDGQPYDRKTYRTLWSNIERLIKANVIITSSEIFDELHDEEVVQWLNGVHCVIIAIDDEIQENVIKIVTSNPKLVNIGQNKSSGDPFLIATAMKYDLTVITEEHKNSPKKIPQVCENMGVDCININGLCLREDWKF